MRLAATIAGLALACLAPVTAAPAKTGASPLRATLTSCTTGAQATDRAATFVGTMPRFPHAVRMEMRFVLLQRRPGDVYTRVMVPKWGSWVRSQPGVPSFSFERRLEELAAPAVYRVHVLFRWRDATGAVVRRAGRWSQVCEQPDPRPDLTLGKLTATATDTPGTSRYDLVVHNEGRTDISVPFEVTLADAAGTTLGSSSLLSLPAGQKATVSITAPACSPATRVRLTADAGGAVDEATERNNTASRTCPVAH